MLKLKPIISAERGDTIVEVLITLAILGLAFAIAYSTASHSLSVTRNAEEHGEALQFLQSQVERLRVASETQAGNLNSVNSADIASSMYDPTQAFCLTQDPLSLTHALVKTPTYPSAAWASQQGLPAPGGSPASGCYVGSETNNGNLLYQEWISYNNTSLITDPLTGLPDKSSGVFTVTISWPGVSTLGLQTEQLKYRVYNLQ